MNRADKVWLVARPTAGAATAAVLRLRAFGADRVPLHGGVVLALNHLAWIDVIAFGYACPRNIRYVAKAEADRVPVMGHVIRALGTFPVRRGESDRAAVRKMREVTRDGEALGIFVEGTRQKSGVPGKAQPGAAMVAITEGAPVVLGAIHGTQTWRLRHPNPVSVAWGEPLRFDGLPRNGRGYKEATIEIERELRRLWSWLVELHELGRPEVAIPPK